jgi:YHS domain-containing protein
MKSLLTFLFLIFVTNGFSQTDEFRVKQFNLDNGTGIKGYDPVAYFMQKKAIKGSKEFTGIYKGVNYHFISSSNLETFRSNPAKYEPQYGGWCAYAMGKEGSKVEVDPETFKIIDGKLFLFYNRFFNNTLKSWNQNEADLHARADANWQKILNQ